MIKPVNFTQWLNIGSHTERPSLQRQFVKEFIIFICIELRLFTFPFYPGPSLFLSQYFSYSRFLLFFTHSHSLQLSLSLSLFSQFRAFTHMLREFIIDFVVHFLLILLLWIRKNQPTKSQKRHTLIQENNYQQPATAASIEGKIRMGSWLTMEWMVEVKGRWWHHWKVRGS